MNKLKNNLDIAFHIWCIRSAYTRFNDSVGMVDFIGEVFHANYDGFFGVVPVCLI